MHRSQPANGCLTIRRDAGTQRCARRRHSLYGPKVTLRLRRDACKAKYAEAFKRHLRRPAVAMRLIRRKPGKFHAIPMVPSPRQLARAFTQHEAVRHMRPNAAAVLPRSPCRTNRKDPTPQCPSKRPVRHACPSACPRGFSKGPVRWAYPRDVSGGPIQGTGPVGLSKGPVRWATSKGPVRWADIQGTGPVGLSKGRVRWAYPRGVSERTCPRRQNHGPAAQPPLNIFPSRRSAAAQRRSTTSQRSTTQRPLNIPAAAQPSSRRRSPASLRSVAQRPLNIPAAAQPPLNIPAAAQYPSRRWAV